MTKSEVDILKLLFLSTAVVIVSGCYLIWKQKYKKLKPTQLPSPKNWRQVGEVQSINLFPLKSGKHQRLDSADCTEVGIKEHDTPGKLALTDR